MKRLLCSIITIVTLFVLLVSTSWAAEIGQQCMMKQGTSVVQKLENPFQPFSGVTVPEDQEVKVTSNILEADLEFLRNNMPGFTEDWSTAFMVEFEYDFGDGQKQVLHIYIRDNDLKDCK